MASSLRSVAASPSREPDPHPNWVSGATAAIRADESRTRWARDVHQALDTLAPTERSFVELSYFHGWQHPQIAAQAGVPAESVSPVIAAGMQKLARALDEIAAQPHVDGPTGRD